MLLAQINQSADFQPEGDAQEVTLCLTETVGIAGQSCTRYKHFIKGKGVHTLPFQSLGSARLYLFKEMNTSIQKGCITLIRSEELLQKLSHFEQKY